MNIVFINPEYPSPTKLDHGGIATFIYTLSNALVRAGHTVHVLVKNGTLTDELDKRIDVRTYGHRSGGSLSRVFERIFPTAVSWDVGLSRGALARVMDIHASHPVDIVEIPEYNGLACAFKRPLPFKVVIHFHTPLAMVDELNQVIPNGERRRQYRLEESALKNAVQCKCNSEGLKKEVCRRYRLPPDSVTVIRNAIETAPFDCIAPEQHPDRIDLLFAGRLERRKGAEIMLNAIGNILSLDDRINVTFAGESSIAQGPNYRDAIERSLAEPLRRRVWFLGPVRRGSLPLLYRRSSIFLLPSLFENAPYSLMEAMAANLPVIAANVNGINELIRHRENGLLFDPADTEAFIACVRTYVNDREKAEKHAAAAYREIQTRYAPDIIANETAVFYKSVKQMTDR